MSPARAAGYLVGGILLAAWLASAAGVSRTPVARGQSPSAETAPLELLAADVQSQSARLRQRLAAAPAPQTPIRNPFVFAAPASRVAPHAGIRQRPAAEEPVPAPLPPPEPAVILLGIAEERGARTAILGAGSELVMAADGETVSGRYRVGKVAPDGVELIDLITGATRHLTLR